MQGVFLQVLHKNPHDGLVAFHLEKQELTCSPLVLAACKDKPLSYPENTRGVNSACEVTPISSGIFSKY